MVGIHGHFLKIMTLVITRARVPLAYSKLYGRRKTSLLVYTYKYQLAKRAYIIPQFIGKGIKIFTCSQN
jgi:hypothetical protein